MPRSAALTLLLLGLLSRTAAAEPTPPLVGLSVGHALAPIGDDDSFSGRMISGYAGARLSSWVALTLRAYHTSDSISDPFEEADDHHDRYVHALPTLRLGRTAWFEVGLGFRYRWREYADGDRDNALLPAFTLGAGVSPGNPTWSVRPELSVGLMSSVGAFALVGVRFTPP